MDDDPEADTSGEHGATTSGPDGPEVEVDPDRGVVVLERIAGELIDVERALQRLDDGTYGRCEVCATAIDDDRLAELPATRTCPAHRAARGQG